MKVAGRWAYLYRAIDKNGETIDFDLRRGHTTVHIRTTVMFLHRKFECPANSFRREVQRTDSIQCSWHDLLDNDMAEAPTPRRHDKRPMAFTPAQANLVVLRVHQPSDRDLSSNSG